MILLADDHAGKEQLRTHYIPKMDRCDNLQQSGTLTDDFHQV
jgi:hypothetical protein